MQLLFDTFIFIACLFFCLLLFKHGSAALKEFQLSYNLIYSTVEE